MLELGNEGWQELTKRRDCSRQKNWQGQKPSALTVHNWRAGQEQILRDGAEKVCRGQTMLSCEGHSNGFPRVMREFWSPVWPLQEITCTW